MIKTEISPSRSREGSMDSAQLCLCCATLLIAVGSALMIQQAGRSWFGFLFARTIMYHIVKNFIYKISITNKTYSSVKLIAFLSCQTQKGVHIMAKYRLDKRCLPGL